MIGVAASADRIEVVNEFFELFKTPWEPFVPGKRYPIVLIADGHGPIRATRKSLSCDGTEAHPIDHRLRVSSEQFTGPIAVGWAIRYCRCTGAIATFRGDIGGGCSRSTAARWITERPSAV